MINFRKKMVYLQCCSKQAADMLSLKSATIIQYTIKGRFMSR